MPSLLFQVLLFSTGIYASTLPGLPTVPFNSNLDGKSWHISNLKSILVDESFADTRNEKGDTLIPPSLVEFADTFAQDLKEVLDVDVEVEIGNGAKSGQVLLTLGDEAEYLDAASRETPEGYSIHVGTNSVSITGASPLGVWWGTRTLLQQLVLGNGTIPHGSGKDSPGWGERGVMLDVGRHYYPAEFLTELCAYMSFYKQNVFQLHLSDNLVFDAQRLSFEEQMNEYGAFRLLSDDPAVNGLAHRPNESYSREVWDNMQNKCAARGVTLIPEIETPGHALPISRWKPEIGMTSDYSLLNISHPETIPTVKTIWKTFLPWFKSRKVHIGADEYRDASLGEADLAEAYAYFCNEITDFIEKEGNKSVRLWGTFSPLKKGNVDRNVLVQHWASFEAQIHEWLENGYEVLNSWDAVYIVGKWNMWYGQELNLDFLFHGGPDRVAFSPHMFYSNDSTLNPNRDDSRVHGHIAPQWNDYGPNATTVLESYRSWRGGLGALADKQWGGQLTDTQYPGLFSALHPHAPGQNLDRRVKTKNSTILDLDFTGKRHCNGTFQDISGNGYHAKTNCANTQEGIILKPGCEVNTPLESKGRNYTLSFKIKPTSEDKGTIFTGRDNALWYGNGTVDNVMMFSGESVYALNYTFPMGEWTQATIRAQGNQTFLDVGDDDPREFLAILGIRSTGFMWRPIAFEAPISKIGGGGFKGIISSMKLVDTDFKEGRH